MSVLGENGINAPKVTLPPLNTNMRQWLEPEQIPKLIAAAVGTPSALPVMLALHSLRRSELLAVTWDDIDLAAGTIRASRAVVQNEDHHVVTEETNKTATSARTVRIMIPELRQSLEDVPPEDRTGRLIPYAPHYIAELVNKACARAGVPEVGTHGLRHSFASLAYHLGMSELETMELGGWADAGTMRKIYTHLSQRDKAKAQNKMRSFYENACSRACD